MIDHLRPPEVPKEIVKDWVINIEPFKGRDYDEYSYLVEPLTEFVFEHGFDRIKVEELNKLVQAILARGREIAPTQIEPSITAKFLADQVKPWVENIRQRLFHSESASFGSVSDAKKWLEKVNERLDEWHKRVHEWNKEVDQWHKRVDEWQKRTDEYDQCWQAILERYPHVKGGIEEWALMEKQGIKVEFPPKEEWQKLTELQCAVESLEVGKVGDPPEQDEEIKIHMALIDAMLEICEVTGFTAESVKMHILTDSPLILPPFTLGIVKKAQSLPSGVNVLNRYASVTIRGDMTFKQLLSLYRSIRRGLGIKRSKPLTKKNLELYEMVTRKSNIPNKKGTIEPFWESIRREWNAHHVKPKYKTWKVVQITYGRTKARLERRIVAKGGTK